MVEISLHILDIVQNSIKANASLIEIIITENISENTFSVSVSDNGCGMSPEFLKDVTNPFRTSRTTRKVGLGISMFKSAAELTGGEFKIDSCLGKGTWLTANFVHDSIDRQPLGDMAATISAIINSNPDIEYVYKHIYNENEFVFDTREIKKVLGEQISLAEFEVLRWIEQYIENETENLYGGV